MLTTPDTLVSHAQALALNDGVSVLARIGTVAEAYARDQARLTTVVTAWAEADHLALLHARAILAREGSTAQALRTDARLATLRMATSDAWDRLPDNVRRAVSR